MKIILALSATLALSTVASAVSANTLTPLDDLLASPQSFDRQTITVAGTVTAILRMSSPGGAKRSLYDTLVVCDGRSCVLARSSGVAVGDLPDVRGEFVNVRGTFNAAKRVGSDLLPEEINVDLVTFSPLHATHTDEVR